MRMKNYDVLSSALYSLAQYMHDIDQSTPKTARYAGANSVIPSKKRNDAPSLYGILSMFALGCPGIMFIRG